MIRSDTEPTFAACLLTFQSRYYLIGEGHKEFLADKTADDDFYVLTLAAIACELEDAHLTEASVYLAVSLPLTWTGTQKAEFADYLKRSEEVRFACRKRDYHVRIVGVKVYPQGYAAVAKIKSQMTGVNLVADIGNGTMNVLYIVDGRPQSGRMFTEKTIYRITTRFDLNDSNEKRAAEYLKGLKHGEGNRFVIDAVLARIDRNADEKLLAQIRQMFREEVKTIPAAAAPAAPVAQTAEPQADMSVLDDLKMFD